MNDNSEATRRAALTEAVDIVADTMRVLKDRGYITGFSLVLSHGEDVFSMAGCCGRHMAEMVHPEIAASSDDPDVKRASDLKAVSDLLSMFRDPRGMMPQVPEAGPVERRTEASDDVRESDAGMLDRYYRMMQNHYPEDDGDGDDSGTGLYL